MHAPVHVGYFAHTVLIFAVLNICICMFFFSTDKNTVTNMMNAAQDTVQMEEVNG